MRVFARFLRGAGWMMGFVALVSQLALGAVVLPDRPAVDARAAVSAVAVLCSGAPVHQHRPARPAPNRAALCPLSTALTLPAVLPVEPFVLAPPRAGWGVARPFGRAPPARLAVAVRAAPPRGPPLLG